jgi:hypothetical protein
MTTSRLGTVRFSMLSVGVTGFLAAMLVLAISLWSFEALDRRASEAQLRRIIDDMSASSTRLRDGLSSVSDVVNRLDAATQQNAALVQQTSQASEGLNALAGRLSESVRAFSLPR